MQRKLIASWLACFAIATPFASAYGADDMTVSLGLRFWDNKWTSWDYYAPAVAGGFVIPGASENFTSSSKAVPIPSVSVRYKDFLFSGSQFVNSSYGFVGSSGAPFNSKRTETDLLAGYYVLPTLALTLGNKEIKQDFGIGGNFKYSGPVLGAAASAPLTGGYSLYGNLGYGFLKAKLPAALMDALGRNSFDANYYLAEIGLAYSFDIRSTIPSAKALTATVGYRNQVLATKDFRVGLSPTNRNLNRGTDLRDTTEGFSFGLSISF